MPYNKGDRPVPNYQLTKLLGRGGFGEVWKALAPGGTEAALKIINLVSGQGLKEYKAIKRIKSVHHPNLCPVVAFWLKDEDGEIFNDEVTEDSRKVSKQATELIIAMGLGDRSLLDRLHECQKEGKQGIPPEELLEYMESSAKAIDFLNQPIHKMSGTEPMAIHHCDIKPQNILIVGGAAQVCDFGLARVMGENRATGTVGTAAYSPPEVITSSQPSRNSDQYSLAISYIELRTGSLPFDSKTPAGAIYAHMQGMLDLSKLTTAEQSVIKRATALDPEKRFATCIEMVRALRRALEKGSGSNTNVSLVESAEELVKPDMEIVPGYKLQRFIGKGGYGEVWEAKAPGGRPVALKIIRDLEIVQGKQEFRALELIKNVEHQHLMEVQAYWLLDKQGNVIPDDQRSNPDMPQPSMLIIATKLAGKNLMERLHECQQQGQAGIPLPELMRYMWQVAQAIDYLNTPQHAHGEKRVAIQHRDVKPENILIAGDHCKLCDFGLAKVLEGTQGVVHGTSAGLTLAYAAPEVFSGTVSAWTDQYSLAITYIQLRTGALPFEASSPYNVIHAHTQGSLDLSKVPESERSALRRALAVRPEDRYTDCRTMIRELRRATGLGSSTSEDLYTTMSGSASPVSVVLPPSPGTQPISGMVHTPIDVRTTPATRSAVANTPTTDLSSMGSGAGAYQTLAEPPGIQQTIIPSQARQDTDAKLHETLANTPMGSGPIYATNPDTRLTPAMSVNTPAQAWKPAEPPKPRSKAGPIAFLILAIGIGIGIAYGASKYLSPKSADSNVSDAEITRLLQELKFTEAWAKLNAPDFVSDNKFVLREATLSKWNDVANARLNRDYGEAAQLAAELLQADPGNARAEQTLAEARSGIDRSIRNFLENADFDKAVALLKKDGPALKDGGAALRQRAIERGIDKAQESSTFDKNRSKSILERLRELPLTDEQVTQVASLLQKIDQGNTEAIQRSLAEGNRLLHQQPKEAMQYFEDIAKNEETKKLYPKFWSQAKLGEARALARLDKYDEIKLADVPENHLDPSDLGLLHAVKAIHEGEKAKKQQPIDTRPVLTALSHVTMELPDWERRKVDELALWSVLKTDVSTFNPKQAKAFSQLFVLAQRAAGADQQQSLNVQKALCLARVETEKNEAASLLAVLIGTVAMPQKGELCLLLADLTDHVEDVPKILGMLDAEMGQLPAEMKGILEPKIKDAAAKQSQRYVNDVLVQTRQRDFKSALAALDSASKLTRWAPETKNSVEAGRGIVLARDDRSDAEKHAEALGILEALSKLKSPPSQLVELAESLEKLAESDKVDPKRVIAVLEVARKNVPEDDRGRIAALINDLKNLGSADHAKLAQELKSLEKKILGKELSPAEFESIKAELDKTSQLATGNKDVRDRLDVLRALASVAGPNQKDGLQKLTEELKQKDVPYLIDICTALAKIAYKDPATVETVKSALDEQLKTLPDGLTRRTIEQGAYGKVMAAMVRRELGTKAGKWDQLESDCKKATSDDPWVQTCLAEVQVETGERNLDTARKQVEAGRQATGTYGTYVNALLLSKMDDAEAPLNAADAIIQAYAKPDPLWDVDPRRQRAAEILVKGANKKRSEPSAYDPFKAPYQEGSDADLAYQWLKKAHDLVGDNNPALVKQLVLAAWNKPVKDGDTVRKLADKSDQFMGRGDAGLDAPLLLLALAEAQAQSDSRKTQEAGLRAYDALIRFLLTQVRTQALEVPGKDMRSKVVDPALKLGKDKLKITRESSPELARAMARVYAAQGRLIEKEGAKMFGPDADKLADEAYDNAIKLDDKSKESAEYYVGRGVARVFQKYAAPDWKAFDAEIKKAKEQDPNYFGAYMWDGFFLFIHKAPRSTDLQKRIEFYVRAIKEFEEAVNRLEQHDPYGELAKCLRYRSQALVDLAHYETSPEKRREYLEEAVRDADRCTSVDRGYTQGYKAKGIALEDLAWIGGVTSKYEDAEQAFKQVLRKSTEPINWIDLGRCQFKWGEAEMLLGNKDKAKELYKEATDNLAEALKLAQIKDTDKPEEKTAKEKAIAEASYFLARAHALSGNAEKALTAFTTAGASPREEFQRLALVDHARFLLEYRDPNTKQRLPKASEEAAKLAEQIGKFDTRQSARIVAKSLELDKKYEDARKILDDELKNRPPTATPSDIDLCLDRLDLLTRHLRDSAVDWKRVAEDADKLIKLVNSVYVGSDKRTLAHGLAGLAHQQAVDPRNRDLEIKHREAAIDNFRKAIHGIENVMEGSPIKSERGWEWRLECAEQLKLLADKTEDKDKRKSLREEALKMAEEAKEGNLTGAGASVLRKRINDLIKDLKVN